MRLRAEGGGRRAAERLSAVAEANRRERVAEGETRFYL